MKTRVTLLFGLLLALRPIVHSQSCTEPLRSISYDTTIIGSGNSFYTLSFPKFDAFLGTLMEVKLESEITLTYNFQLENRENITINNYRVRVTRDDEISGPALVNPITNSQVRTYGPYSLTAWDGNAGAGSDFTSRGPLYVMNHSNVSQTVYNVADYLGSGTVDFDYSTTTYSSVLGSVNYTFNATASDTVHLRLTYYYCATWFMAADISSFNASKKADEIDLQWITVNEEKDRVYEIQKSYNGRNFETIARRTSQPDANQTGTYRHSYAVEENNNESKIIFRLKQIEKDGAIKYSVLRVVDIKKKVQNLLRVYPNPAHSNSQLIFSNTKRGNWEVEIFNASGMRMKQYRFLNALTGKLDGLQHLKKGIYFIKAIDRSTLEVRSVRLLISGS